MKTRSNRRNAKFLNLGLLVYMFPISTFSQCPTESTDQTFSCEYSTIKNVQIGYVNYQVRTTSCCPITISRTTVFPTACNDYLTGQISIDFPFYFYSNVDNIDQHLIPLKLINQKKMKNILLLLFLAFSCIHTLAQEILELNPKENLAESKTKEVNDFFQLVNELKSPIVSVSMTYVNKNASLEQTDICEQTITMGEICTREQHDYASINYL
jgi:hypothetical protein